MSSNATSYFVHPNAICDSPHVGENTRIWGFSHILPGARIGAEANICEGVFIENDVIVGNRVTVKCGVQLWDGVVLEDDVFVGPNATFTNDPFPRSKEYPENYSKTVVCKGASIGANATILPNLVIGRKAMVGAGAVVTHSVPPNAIVVGNPARIVGYVGIDKIHQPAFEQADNKPVKNIIEAEVSGVKFFRLSRVKDMRGELTVGEFQKDIPFTPKRYFLVFDVPSENVRGEHAHRKCHQFLVCAKGSCSVVADDGTHRQEFALNDPSFGVYIPPMVWGVQYKYSKDAVLMVFASEYYDPEDYIRDYDLFLKEKGDALSA